MASFLSRNMLVIALVGVLILVGAWYMFSGSDEEAVLTSESVSESESATERGIVDTLLTLRAVTLSGTIFSDPAFRVLRDFGTEIIPEPAGRLNPFAPRDFDTQSQETSPGA